MTEKTIKQIMDAEEIDRKLTRIATEIAQRNMTAKEIALVGIVRRGVPLAKRLAEKMKELTPAEIHVGSLDITLYGADHNLIDRFPVLNHTDIPFSIAGMPVILVDDIFYTGKTIHKALNALLEVDEPEEVQLAVFLDRGRRAFPISADYVGARVPSSRLERVALHLGEVDDIDEVVIEKRGY
ncbi:MAG: bifunctional pyr operon transcriptional regulator/uracil phosphoribosyltransferase PyrR [Clostridia bacterium]|nr:bifunctional pyr operon transcriptional regulator/uracil phosphoribosyltransferase PyrR [Clostridia bacterium]